MVKLNEASRSRVKADPIALAILLIAVAIAPLFGCQHRVQGSVSRTVPTSQPLNGAANVAVPLPARTPFDDDTKLRMVYLEFYANGYVLAATNSDYASPGCLCEASGDIRRYDAMSQGFFAGRKAGAQARPSGVRRVNANQDNSGADF